MPKRSNDFQQLIAMLLALLEDGAIVEESKEFPDPDTDKPREVDVYVLIRGKLDGKEITVGVECIDHKRKADVTWVEKMYGKHSVLQVADVVLLVSSSGFTWAAGVKAEAFGYHAITPKVSKEQLAEHLRIADDLKLSMKIAMVHRSDMKLNVTATFPPGVEIPAGGLQIHPDDRCFRRADGSELVTMDEYQLSAVLEVMQSDDVPLFLKPEAVQETRTIAISEPEHQGERLHMKATSSDGKITAMAIVNSLTFDAHIDATDKGDMEQTTEGEFAGLPFTTGTTTIGGQPARMVVARTPDGGFKAMAQTKYTVKERNPLTD